MLVEIDLIITVITFYKVQKTRKKVKYCLFKNSPIVAVTFRSNRDIKFHQVVSIIGLRLSQIPFDA